MAHQNTDKLNGGIETHFPALPSHFSFICILLITNMHIQWSAAHAADTSYLKFIDFQKGHAVVAAAECRGIRRHFLYNI